MNGDGHRRPARIAVLALLLVLLSGCASEQAPAPAVDPAEDARAGPPPTGQPAVTSEVEPEDVAEQMPPAAATNPGSAAPAPVARAEDQLQVREQSAEDEAEAEPTPSVAPETDEAVPSTAATPSTAETVPSDDRAANAAAVDALCVELGERLGSVSIDGCRSHEIVAGTHRSHGGRALAWADYASDGGGPAPRVLVVGGIHGDEYSSVSMVFRWMERLETGADRSRHWRLIPVANPDGLLAVRPATRTNARGVDLNRNFATASWNDEARRYWQERTGGDPRRDPGREAASETETRWLQQFIDEFGPDVIVALHAPHALLDFDAADAGRVRAPQRLGFLELRPLGTFPGSLGRYGSVELGIPVLTLELPWAGIMPSAEQQQALWSDLDGWLERNLPTDVTSR